MIISIIVIVKSIISIKLTDQAARRNREIPADRTFNQLPTSPTNAQSFANADADAVVVIAEADEDANVGDILSKTTQF